MPKTAAGILLYRRRADDGRLEVLLGHPGGPFFTTRTDGIWSIPKGEAADGEDLFDVARREFSEETGHPAPEGEGRWLGTVTGRSGKVVHAWAFEGELDPTRAVSNTFDLEWPPRSGRIVAFPEIDRWAWFGLDDARRVIGAAQVGLLERLETLLTGSRYRA